MHQPNDTELFHVQPDRPPAPPPDIGIHSWPFGSYAPMGFYRPAPIVHFTGTVVVQSATNFLLYALLIEAPGAFTIGTCTVIALVVARRAFVRWLGQASPGWMVATVVALVLNLLLVSLASLARG